VTRLGQFLNRLITETQTQTNRQTDRRMLLKATFKLLWVSVLALRVYMHLDERKQ